MSKEIYSHDFDNFLHPQVLQNFKDSNFLQTLGMMKDVAKRKIWKPDKFIISKKSDVSDSLHS